MTRRGATACRCDFAAAAPAAAVCTGLMNAFACLAANRAARAHCTAMQVVPTLIHLCQEAVKLQGDTKRARERDQKEGAAAFLSCAFVR
jgi:hypothetical protein